MSLLKKIYWSIPPLRFLFRKYIKLKHYYRTTFLSDEKFIKTKFKDHMGYKLDLNNPTTLNEKINWLILNDRTPLHTICADKFKVRDYIADKIGDKYLIPLVYHTENSDTLGPDIIPDYPVILKSNHNSGDLVIVHNKHTIDWKKVRKNFKASLKQNYYTHCKQWQYKNIKPLVVIEKLLMDNEGNIPADYKLHCFNGKVRMMSIDKDRDTTKHSRTWFTREWNLEPYSWSYKKKGGGFTDPLTTEIPKPKSLELMVELSEKLAQEFDYVRVDWYNLDGTLFFGELTFHHSGGLRPILPKKWDTKLGQELKLVKSKS